MCVHACDNNIRYWNRKGVSVVCGGRHGITVGRSTRFNTAIKTSPAFINIAFNVSFFFFFASLSISTRASIVGFARLCRISWFSNRNATQFPWFVARLMEACTARSIDPIFARYPRPPFLLFFSLYRFPLPPLSLSFSFTCLHTIPLLVSLSDSRRRIRYHR